MSQQRIEVVRAIYAYSSGNLVTAYNDEEWTRAGVEAFGYLAHDEFEFVLIRGEALGDAVHRGIEGFFSAMREWFSDWESYEIDAEEVIEIGDTILVLTRERGLSQRGHVPVSQEGAVIYTFRGDRVLRIETYLERSKAMAALRLPSGLGSRPDAID